MPIVPVEAVDYRRHVVLLCGLPLTVPLWDAARAVYEAEGAAGSQPDVLEGQASLASAMRHTILVFVGLSQ